MCLLSVLKDENQVKGAKILGYRTDCSRNASDAGQQSETGVPERLPVVGEALLLVYKHRRVPLSSGQCRPITHVNQNLSHCPSPKMFVFQLIY
jgi:hypothetical protein